jgi:hypothetical protein
VNWARILQWRGTITYQRPIASAIWRRMANSSSFAIHDEVFLTRAAEPASPALFLLLFTGNYQRTAFVCRRNLGGIKPCPTEKTAE